MKVKDWKAKYFGKDYKIDNKKVPKYYYDSSSHMEPDNTVVHHHYWLEPIRDYGDVEKIAEEHYSDKNLKHIHKHHLVSRAEQSEAARNGDENAGKEIDETERFYKYLYLSPEEKQKLREKEKKNGITHFPDYTQDDYNEGKIIKVEPISSSKHHLGYYKLYGGKYIKHIWSKKPTYKEAQETQDNYDIKNYRNSLGREHIHIWGEKKPFKLKSAKASELDNNKDENADKNIETSQENGYSEEQAKAVPNDTLVKDDKDADIKTDDASPKNLEEIKDGNLDAKISPDSDFKLSPEMEKWLIANGWKKPSGEKQNDGKDENAGKKISDKYITHSQENTTHYHHWRDFPTLEEEKKAEEAVADKKSDEPHYHYVYKPDGSYVKYQWYNRANKKKEYKSQDSIGNN